MKALLSQLANGVGTAELDAELTYLKSVAKIPMSKIINALSCRRFLVPQDAPKFFLMLEAEGDAVGECLLRSCLQYNDSENFHLEHFDFLAQNMHLNQLNRLIDHCCGIAERELQERTFEVNSQGCDDSEILYFCFNNAEVTSSEQCDESADSEYWRRVCHAQSYWTPTSSLVITLIRVMQRSNDANWKRLLMRAVEPSVCPRVVLSLLHWIKQENLELSLTTTEKDQLVARLLQHCATNLDYFNPLSDFIEWLVGTPRGSELADAAEARPLFGCLIFSVRFSSTLWAPRAASSLRL